MVEVGLLCQSFEEIIGWPYHSPGTNDKNGIDCSGAFVRAYRAQNASIYHGSNTIYRKHCAVRGAVPDVRALEMGMAVFKHRNDGGEPDKYKNDGIGNLYHIGLVVSASPLRIIHATPPKAKVDTALGNWSHYGILKDVKYREGTGMENPGEVLYVAVVTAKNGSTVNLRKTAGKDAQVLEKVPVGVHVSVYRESGDWAYVRYAGQTGYMMLEYLVDVESIPDGSGAPQDAPDKVTVTLDRTAAQTVFAALQRVL